MTAAPRPPPAGPPGARGDAEGYRRGPRETEARASAEAPGRPVPAPGVREDRGSPRWHRTLLGEPGERRRRDLPWHGSSRPPRASLANQRGPATIIGGPRRNVPRRPFPGRRRSVGPIRRPGAVLRRDVGSGGGRRNGSRARRRAHFALAQQADADCDGDEDAPFWLTRSSSTTSREAQGGPAAMESGPRISTTRRSRSPDGRRRRQLAGDAEESLQPGGRPAGRGGGVLIPCPPPGMALRDLLHRLTAAAPGHVRDVPALLTAILMGHELHLLGYFRPSRAAVEGP